VETIGSQELALNDREVDLDLVEPTGVNRRMDHHDVWPLGASVPSPLKSLVQLSESEGLILAWAPIRIFRKVSRGDGVKTFAGLY
jgi:hypothetical protein